jgi:peptidoglycan/xylan/chitin deacetylase (PgdA/CDA1 family)
MPGGLVRASEEQADLGGSLFVPRATSQSAAGNTIYLTFDDGLIGLAEKLAAVNALGVQATFFPTGQAISSHPGDIQALVNDGHVLGNHTWDHADLTKLSATNVRSEIQRCEAIAQSVAGVSTAPLMRPPYGAVNATVRNIAAGLGYQSILWNWDTRDWAGSSTSYIEQNFGAGIVLMHTQGRNTVAALSDIVPALASQGYTFDVL